ncbi:hypothetical protein [Prosthecomicrobium sp. N25]|uniref:hypothetical protein n=1 Tax=Prosthecomicrobium sp. N25 TaxID=3129254 RepID=UPI0030773F01
MNPIDVAIGFWVDYIMAPDPAKAAAWSRLVYFLAENPAAFEGLCGAGSVLNKVAVDNLRAAVLRVLAARLATRQLAAAGAEALVTESVSARFLIMRMATVYGRVPKLPTPPQVQLAIGLAIIIGTTGQAFAEGNARKAKAEAYQEYIVDYFLHVVKIGQMHPRALPRIVPPKTFDEWYAENA